MIRTSSTHQLGSLQSTLLDCLPDGTERIPHGLIRRMQPQLGEWGATSLTNLPGETRCCPLHAHLACLAVLASGDGVTVTARTPCHFLYPLSLSRPNYSPCTVPHAHARAHSR